MARACLGALLLLAACNTRQVTTRRLNDGSLSVTCRLSMADCMQRVQDECEQQRFRILEGSSETRLSDVPPYERAYHTSQLRLMCGNDTKALFDFGSKKPDGATPPPPRPAPASCSRGQTRECVGPGACKGGQVCLPDGTGFGACDCGPAPSTAAAASSAVPSVPAPAPPEQPATP